MPTYDFKCNECNLTAEYFGVSSDKDAEPPACFGCGNHNMERLVNDFNIGANGKLRPDGIAFQPRTDLTIALLAAATPEGIKPIGIGVTRTHSSTLPSEN